MSPNRAIHDPGVHGFAMREAIMPFEAVFAFFCFYQGFSALLGLGLVSQPMVMILGSGLLAAVNIGLAVSGIMMFWGIGSGKRHIEAFGLFLVMASLVLRSAALLVAEGLNPQFVNNYVYSSAFALACILRLRKLYAGRVLVEITPGGI